MRNLPALPTYDKDAVTRRLCSAVHLDDEFAREVREELMADRLTAIGLPLGINLLALARHAARATARTDARDARLAWLFGCLCASVIVVLVGIVQGTGAVTGVGTAVILAVIGLAWWLVHRTEAESRGAAIEVCYAAERPLDLAPEVGQETEARLRDLKRPNVLPYTQSAERSDPFVGSGSRIKESVWQPIDISRPAAAPGGGKLALVPFDAVDLHTYVAKEMANIAGLEGLRSQNRLYVIGTQVRYLGEDVLPDPLKLPLSRIPSQLVKAGLVSPGAGMRTYLSLERVGEGGRVIVSLHLRARLHGPSLSWEVAAYAIPPLAFRYYRADYLPRDGFERWWNMVRFATSHTWPALGGALGRIYRRGSDSNRRLRALEKSRKEISKRHALYDYGATESMRERVASWDQLGHAERMDSQDFLHRLQQGVLIATERFLIDHHVDTGSFDQALQIITTQTYNITGNISGPSNFGNSGQIAASYGQQGAHPSASPGRTP